MFRVAFHCHSFLSHDSDVCFERIAAAARQVGVNAVILTDHYEPGNLSKTADSLIDGVLLIPGVELRAMGGSMLTVGLHEDFDKTLPRAALSQQFREQGALVVAGHAENITSWGELPFDGFEVYNLHAEFAQKSPWSILWRFVLLFPDSFFESSITFPEKNLKTWDRLAMEGDLLFPVVGCDAHANVKVFGPLGGVIGTYPEIVRLLSNHVLATGLREDLILDALRRGRVYCVFDYLGDATGFSLTYGKAANDAGSHTRAILGGHVPFDPQSTLDVEVPVESPVRILKDGKLFAERLGTRLRERLSGPGIYRVEVYREGRLWILSSPIYVE